MSQKVQEGENGGVGKSPEAPVKGQARTEEEKGHSGVCTAVHTDSLRCQSPFCASPLPPDSSKARQTCSDPCRTDLSMLRRLAKRFGVDPTFLFAAVEQAKGNGAALPKRIKPEDDPKIFAFMKEQFEISFRGETLRPAQIIFRISKGAKLCRLSKARQWLERFISDGFIEAAGNGLLRWQRPDGIAASHEPTESI